MIKTTQAHIVYTPLLTTFCMKTVGGSPQQKYDALHQVYVPDRQIAELRFIPNLQVQDPDGYVTPIGVAVDMTSKLVNCKWYLNNVQLVAGEDYDFSRGQLNLKVIAITQQKVTLNGETDHWVKVEY